MHRGEKQKSENGTEIRTTTNSEKNMIVKFRSKTFYMTSEQVSNSRKKEYSECEKWKERGRTSDYNSWNETDRQTEWWRELVMTYLYTSSLHSFSHLFIHAFMWMWFLSYMNYMNKSSAVWLDFSFYWKLINYKTIKIWQISWRYSQEMMPFEGVVCSHQEGL